MSGIINNNMTTQVVMDSTNILMHVDVILDRIMGTPCAGINKLLILSLKDLNNKHLLNGYPLASRYKST